MPNQSWSERLGRLDPSRQSRSSRLPSSLVGLRVVVVDDDEDTVELFAAALSACGATVTTATNAVDALRLGSEVRPDVVLSDIAMARGDGYWLVGEIKRLDEEALRRIPVVAATAFGRFFPMLITAAGTARPAKVLVLGTGVAGLQAIGTARRLGAVVSGYDVRPQSKTEVESLGATFIELTSVGPAAGEGGYARALTDDERQAQQAELIGHIARHDVVITTAQVPGRRPPLLLTEDAIKAMSPGSVVVDMGSGPLGGNVAGSVPGETIVTGNGVTIIGAANLATSMPTAASAAYARNVTTLLLHMVADGTLAIDPSDDIQAGVVITHGGSVIHPATAALLTDQPAGGTSP